MRRSAGAADVYNLAANMGGMGFIENNKAVCMLSVLINTHMLLGRAEALMCSGSSTPLQRASTLPTADAIRTSRPQGERRVSGDAGRRVWLGEALQRAHVPALQ